MTQLNRWISFRLETVANIVIFTSSILSILFKNYFNSTILGLSILYSLKVTDSLNMLIRWMVEIESDFVSGERILEYSNLEVEEDYENNFIKNFHLDPCKIEFKNVNMRYRDDLPLVLKDLSFVIEPGEKVGIIGILYSYNPIGRTGSGKSSILQVLFRFVKLDFGDILIDDETIFNINLQCLRKVNKN
jgi:ATP-binding cassette, subfamily C (CFTR/MRP), member 1